MTEEFLNAIAWVRGSAKPLDVAAPPGIVADLQAGSDGEVIVHLVDYDLQRSGGRTFAVAVRAPGAKAMRVFPFGEEPQELTPMEENGIVFIDLIVNVSYVGGAVVSATQGRRFLVIGGGARGMMFTGILENELGNQSGRNR